MYVCGDAMKVDKSDKQQVHNASTGVQMQQPADVALEKHEVIGQHTHSDRVNISSKQVTYRVILYSSV